MAITALFVSRVAAMYRSRFWANFSCYTEIMVVFAHLRSGKLIYAYFKYSDDVDTLDFNYITNQTTCCTRNLIDFNYVYYYFAIIFNYKHHAFVLYLDVHHILCQYSLTSATTFLAHVISRCHWIYLLFVYHVHIQLIFCC